MKNAVVAIGVISLFLAAGITVSLPSTKKRSLNAGDIAE